MSVFCFVDGVPTYTPREAVTHLMRGKPGKERRAALACISSDSYPEDIVTAVMSATRERLSRVRARVTEAEESNSFSDADVFDAEERSDERKRSRDSYVEADSNIESSDSLADQESDSPIPPPSPVAACDEAMILKRARALATVALACDENSAQRKQFSAAAAQLMHAYVHPEPDRRFTIKERVQLRFPQLIDRNLCAVGGMARGAYVKAYNDYPTQRAVPGSRHEDWRVNEYTDSECRACVDPFLIEMLGA